MPTGARRKDGQGKAMKPGGVLDCYRPVLAFFRARLGRSTATDAEDLAQETIMAALRALDPGGGAPVEHVEAYVLGIARHKLNDELRARRARAASRGSDEDAREEGAVAAAAAEERLVERERAAVLRREIAALSAVERNLLMLSFYDECDHATACRRVGVPPDEGSRIKYRALAKLRARVKRLERPGGER